MTIEGSAAYLHARYEKGSRFENQLVGGELVEVDRSGEPITQAPKWTASIGATQEFEFEAGILKLHADYAYIASRYFDYFTRSEEHTSELQSLMRISYAVFCLKKKKQSNIKLHITSEQLKQNN